MLWSYGVTSVDSRLNDLLPRTLESLAAGGFPSPRLFIDNCREADVPEPLRDKYEITCRWPRLRTHGNWVLALYELYIREPRAERYAVFQDDFVCVRNLRQYLEQVPYPEKCYLNLYTFPENEKPLKGFYPSNQLGKAAVALVFSREAVQTLLASPHMVERPTNLQRGHKAVDGGIVSAMKKAGWKEYVHNPSLTQHTGDRSSMGNRRHPKARTFRGEEFDALDLLKEDGLPSANTFNHNVGRKGGRIGLVGYNTASGLGEVNRAIARYAEIDVWLIKPHARLTTQEPPDTCDAMVCGRGVRVEEFLQSVDIVVFAETPYYDRLLGECAKRNIRTYLIPMHEWAPSGARGWMRQVNQSICPTAYSFRQFKDNVPCALFPWPCDTGRFPFRQRGTVERFVYIHAKGGHRGRKGGAVVQELIKRWPDIPLTVFDRTNQSWGNCQTFRGQNDNRDLYREGDVLLVPHAVDGLGLEPLEAACVGMPIISTSGHPWSEYPALDRINSTVSRVVFKRPVEFFSADAAHLEELCRKWLGQDVSRSSIECRAWAQGRSWKWRGDALTRLLRGEIKNQEELDAALDPRPPKPEAA